MRSGRGGDCQVPKPGKLYSADGGHRTAHDMTSKILFNGTTMPSGQSTSQDLSGALTNIFNDQNVGPFICRQLIQHLVASNPSAAYVARVSAFLPMTERVSVAI